LQICFSEARKEENSGGVRVTAVESFTGSKIPDDSPADGTKALRLLQEIRSVILLHLCFGMEIECDRYM